MNHLFSDNVKSVINLSRDEAKRIGHSFIGTEHILLGILQKGDCSAIRLLSTQELDLDILKKSVENFIASSGSDVTTKQLPFTPRTKQILANSANEARELHQKPVGTTHLLLVLAKDTEGIAGLMLAKAGISYETLREKLLNT